jgi:hypothetical protein
MRPKGCRMAIIEAVWQPEEAKAEEVAPAATTEAEVAQPVVAAKEDGQPAEESKA